MKKFIFLLVLMTLALLGCNSGSNSTNGDSTNKSASSGNSTTVRPSKSPKAVIEKYIADAEKGEIEEMDKAFSDATLQQRGYGVKQDNKTFSDRIKEIGAKEKASIVNLQEKVNGDTAQVTLDYGIVKNGAITGKSTGCLSYEMVKEKGEWRIVNPQPCM